MSQVYTITIDTPLEFEIYEYDTQETAERMADYYHSNGKRIKLNWEYTPIEEGELVLYHEKEIAVLQVVHGNNKVTYILDGGVTVFRNDFTRFAEPIEEEEEDDYLSPEAEAKLKALYKELKETLEAQWVEPNDDGKLVPIQELNWTGWKAIYLELGDAEGFEINNDNGQYWDDYRPVCTVTAPAIVTHYKDGETWREALITKALRDEIYKAMHIHITD
jgi:hypothetical protein